MTLGRRQFLYQLGGLTAAGLGLRATEPALASGGGADPVNSLGVLVDLTLCVGCRLCEHACKEANGIDPGPLASYDDKSVFAEQRRPSTDAFTVVNEHKPSSYSLPVYAKVNCLHCNHPACVSACIVGALKKQDSGAVTYDAWKCIGCRYCMVACPFQIPTYEYDDVWTPEVRKCQLCFNRAGAEGKPGCVEACPREALICGTRRELLELAHERIAKHPDRYVDHVYGEHEVGGTAWMYISPAPFEELGFVKLGSEAPPELTESIQHGVFKYGLPPLALYGLLGLAMFVTRRNEGGAALLEPPGDEAGTDRMTGAATAETVAGRCWVRDSVPAVDRPRASGEKGALAVPLPAEPKSAEPQAAEHHAHEHEHPAPVAHPFFTPGTWVVLAVALAGLGAMAYRFLFGLGAATNLDQQHPWGLWIGIDVATGVALAAGGFTSGALAHVFHREHYHAIVRPALLTAMLGYTFVVIGLQADLGRYYNVWHPMFMWQGNSVLFEVGMCVMCYLNVLYLEFAPIVCERVERFENWPRLAGMAKWVRLRLEKVMFILIIAGCVLSCLHQSSLGNLMVIAPSKMHPLWWTPISPLLFLLSAIAVGFPMIIFESLLASRSLKLKPEMNVLSALSRYVPVFLGLYLAFKVADMAVRGTYGYLLDGSFYGVAWLAEVGLGVVLPMALLLTPRVRRSPAMLFVAAALVVGGVVLNRVNVFLVGYRPPYADGPYVPSMIEFAVTLGLIATLVLVYRACVIYLPVISHPAEEGMA